ncbi:MAG: hypothetical protein KAU01_11090, partial [Candidatus Cloacimonetes bacterium]|nr:hypothetical protein [Candidatus Cloacimonadota bacterium]
MTNNTQKTSLNTSIIPHLIRTPLQALVAFFILLCFCFGLSLYFSDDVYIHYIFVIFILLYIL